MNIGVFWKYWLLGGAIYIGERVLREVRARHRTYISKVIQHPSKVVEIQIRKEKTEVRYTYRSGVGSFSNAHRPARDSTSSS
jgi:NADPH oxidase